MAERCPTNKPYVFAPFLCILADNGKGRFPMWGAAFFHCLSTVKFIQILH
ncbi:hypothetical protein ANACOL_01508 [Anaerotruncus colihominis DSM 17241]|uniref:Uncharacterized protein n=1 Tax=Anaerotruncus colihominis DSM 17241 TaxID=445972 RepID=B0P9T9_9FIRM|nr:hypothetical protein ANACOL_01508 [Anaerotruncus colihominis DSM 17241]